MSRTYRVLPAALVLMLMLPMPAAFAQSDRGSILGRVADSSNAVLQGASVAVMPGGIRTATNTEGEYAINALVPGTYTVTVSFVGLMCSVSTMAVRNTSSSVSSTSPRSRSDSVGTRSASWADYSS